MSGRVVEVALLMAAIVAHSALPAFAHGSCQAFGRNIAGLATASWEVRPETAAGSAPLNDTVVQEQAALCRPG